MKPRNHKKKHEIVAFFFVLFSVISRFRILYSGFLFRAQTLVISLCCIGLAFPLFSQDLPPIGSVKIIGKTKITGETVTLDRKRFYLMRGGLKDYENLIKRLKSTEIISRDCFYSNLKASQEFMCWLKQNDCESPYCREITMEDVKEVPEFLAAYQKNLRPYGGQSEIARLWLTTTLPFDLREGFYRQQKSVIKSLLPDARPIQTIMTDKIGVAYFIDIPLNLDNAGGTKKKTETFLISNLLPLEIGETSYVWACEVEIGKEKQATLNFSVETNRCVIVSRDLPVCKTQSCETSK